METSILNRIKVNVFRFASLYPHKIVRITLAASYFLAVSANGLVLPLAHALQGSTLEYTVKEGDTLGALAGRFGEDRDVLARENGIDPNDYTKSLTVGQKLVVNDLHIVPDVAEDNIYINLAQRRLFFFKDGELLHTYLVGVGDPDWQTPVGSFRVINHIKDKTWIVPKSIQAEMKARGQPVLASVPPGPDNPLGGYWVGLSHKNIGIHGTPDQDSIFRYASHGCMHLGNGDIEDFFSRVKVGDKGQTVYSSVMLAALPDGRIFLEVHPDVYRKDADPQGDVQEMTARTNISPFIDWNRVTKVLAEKAGYAIQVGAGANVATQEHQGKGPGNNNWRPYNWMPGDIPPQVPQNMRSDSPYTVQPLPYQWLDEDEPYPD